MNSPPSAKQNSPLRTLQLTGLDIATTRKILQDYELTEIDENSPLIDCYDGNPFWVKSLASQIQELGGFVPDILKNDTLLLPEDVKCILRQQYDRLSETEKQVMVLLAGESEPISLGGLLEMAIMPPADCLNSIQSLLRRCWLEKPDNLYRLPKAIKQYIIHHLI